MDHRIQVRAEGQRGTRFYARIEGVVARFEVVREVDTDLWEAVAIGGFCGPHEITIYYSTAHIQAIVAREVRQVSAAEQAMWDAIDTAREALDDVKVESPRVRLEAARRIIDDILGRYVDRGDGKLVRVTVPDREEA